MILNNQATNVIQKLRLTFVSLSISGIVKAGRDTLCKYEYSLHIYRKYVCHI